MGIDFDVNVSVKTTGKEQVDALERQIESLKSQTVNIKFNTSGLENLKMPSSIAKQAQSIGQQAGKNYSNALSKEIQRVQNNINNFKYDSVLTKMNAQLSRYSNQSGNIWLERATSAQKSYADSYKQLQNLLQSGLDVNDEEVVSAFNNMTKANEQFKNAMSIVGTEMTKTLDKGIAERSANKVKAYMETNTKALQKYRTELENLENEYRTISTQGQKLDLDNRFRNLQAQISAEGLTGKSRLSEFKRAMGQIAEFAGVYGLIQNVAFEVPRQMAQAVMDINAAQIELAKVSEASPGQLSQYWEEAAVSAEHYGATISDVINSTADWSRLGYNLEEAKKLSDATTLMQRIGDNMTQQSSSEGLVSTLQGFQLEADEVTKVVDEINEVANTQPIDTAGLFAGLERSASSMSSANNTLEETIALITAGNAVLQDPERVGNGLKTISMRIRGATTELEAAGESTEGMATSTASLRKEVMALAGIDIMQDETTFKSTYDILDELSEKWQGLTDIQRASLTELLAGKHQGNLMSSIMGSFDIARESLNTAMNDSEGSAERELSNYQKGIQYSLDRFKAQFQELSTTTLDSDLFKGVIDSGTAFLDVLTSIIDVGGGIPALLGAIGGIKLFKNLDWGKSSLHLNLLLSESIAVKEIA